MATLYDVFMDQIMEHMKAVPACERVLQRSRDTITTKVRGHLIIVTMRRHSNELAIGIYPPDQAQNVIESVWKIEDWAADPEFIASTVSGIAERCV